MRRGGNAGQELRRAQLHSGEEAEGAAPLAGQGRRAEWRSAESEPGGSDRRRTRTQQLTHDQAQVEAAYVDQLPLQNVLVSAQMGAPHAAGFIAMREAAFDQVTAPPEQALAVTASHPPPILVYRLLLLLVHLASIPGGLNGPLFYQPEFLDSNVRKKAYVIQARKIPSARSHGNIVFWVNRHLTAWATPDREK